MNPRAHVFVVYIRTTAEKLWDGLTTPEFTRRYFHATAIESDWKAGSPVTYKLPDGALAVEGKVLACERLKKLSISWAFRYSPDVAGDPPSRVTFEIEPVGDSCKLTVTHDEFATETATFKAVGGGWPGILSSLKSLLETGEPLNLG